MEIHQLLQFPENKQGKKITIMKEIDERQKRINAHEIVCRRYAEMAINCIYSACAHTRVYGEDTPVKCHIDYRASAISTSNEVRQTTDIEVKTIAPKYAKGGTPLKISKYENMKKDHFNQLLLYLSVESDGTAYIYNLTKIDLEKEARHTLWNLKKVEWLPESLANPKVPTPMYIIPKSLASYKIQIPLNNAHH